MQAELSTQYFVRFDEETVHEALGATNNEGFNTESQAEEFAWFLFKTGELLWREFSIFKIEERYEHVSSFSRERL